MPKQKSESPSDSKSKISDLRKQKMFKDGDALFYLDYLIKNVDDSISINYDFKLKSPFTVSLGESKQKQVYQGELSVIDNLNPLTGEKYRDQPLLINPLGNIKIFKPTQNIDVKINPELFLFSDTPALIRQITQTYNKWNEKLPNRNDRGGFKSILSRLSEFYSNKTLSTSNQSINETINPGLTIANRYISVISILEEALSHIQDTTKNSSRLFDYVRSGTYKEIHELLLDELYKLNTLLKDIVKEYGEVNSSNKDILNHPKKKKILDFLINSINRHPDVINRRLPKLISIAHLSQLD